MKYIENSLTEGEKLIHFTKLHWIVLLRGLISFIMTIIIFALVIAIVYYSLEHYQKNIEYFKKYYIDYFNKNKKFINSVLLLSIAAVGITIVFKILKNLIYFMTTEACITNKRVLIKYGLISRATDETFINKIEGVDVRQSIAGRLLNFGYLIVTATGGSTIYFTYIPDPLLFRSKIQEQIGKA